MYSNITDVYPNLHKFTSKQEFDVFGVIKYFPGGKYYTQYTQADAYVYDTDDKVVWQGRTSFVQPVSEKQFVIEVEVGESYENELVTLRDDFIEDRAYVAVEKLDTNGVCRICNGVVVLRDQNGYYRIETEETAGTIYVGTHMNNRNMYSNTLAFIHNGTLRNYDKELQYVANIHPGFHIHTFYYYPENHTVTLYGNCTYQVWDTRFTLRPISNVNILGTPHAIITIGQVTYFVQFDHIEAMHYLYPEQYRERFDIKDTTNIFYNAALHSIDYFRDGFRYRCKIH